MTRKEKWLEYVRGKQRALEGSRETDMVGVESKSVGRGENVVGS